MVLACPPAGLALLSVCLSAAAAAFPLSPTLAARPSSRLTSIARNLLYSTGYYQDAIIVTY